MTDTLLAEALKAGVPVLVFWDMTPRETAKTIEAANWCMDQDQRARAWLAWHVAALSRVKRLPPLSRLVNPPEAKRLEPDQAEARRQEFAEMKARWKSRPQHE